MGRLSIIFLFLLLIPFVSANDPTIDSVIINASSFDPIEAGTVMVKVEFNVSDLDGNQTLNLSRCKCEFDNSATWQEVYENAVDTSCTELIIDDFSVQYTCEVPMLFWYEATTFSVNVTAGDNADKWAHNVSSTFTYNILLASDIDSSLIDFGSLNFDDWGTDKIDTNSPFVINNTGNQVISLNVTGADLADSNGIADNVSVSNFYVDIDSDIAGATQLSYTSGPISGSSVPVATSGSDGLEQLWWFFSIPASLQYGTYSGLWTLDET